MREVYIAPTDELARKRVIEGAMGRCWREYLLPFYLRNGMVDHFKVEADDADSDVTLEYLVDRSWWVGSPSTIVDKIGELQHTTGGFGSVLVVIYDFSTEQEAWDESLHLLTHEVLPQL